MVLSFLDWQWWAWLIAAPVIFGVSFYLPGAVFWRWAKPKSPVIAVLHATTLGVVLFGWQGFIFGFLHARWLTYTYLLLAIGLGWCQRQEHCKTWQQIWQQLLRQRGAQLVLLVILAGSLLQVLATFPSGMLYHGQLEYFYTNTVDGVMHLAYIQSIAHAFPPQEPGAAGLAIRNYHYWSDLVMADLARVWHIPVSELFFQIFPLGLMVATGLASWLVMGLWTKSRAAAWWGLFFLFFGSDMAFAFTLLIHHTWGVNTPVIDDGMTQLLNLPHVFAKCIFMVGLIPLTYWLRTKKNKWLALTVALFAALIGFKVYFGMFAALGMGMILLVHIIQSLRKIQWSAPRLTAKTLAIQHAPSIAALVLMEALSLAIYLPANRSAGGLFWAPLAWPKVFLGVDGINFQLWWLRMQIYDATHNWRGQFLLDVIAIIICLLSVYGTRLLGFLPPFKNKKLLANFPFQIFWFFFPPMIFFTLLGLFTLQQSGLFNVFNFFSVAAVGLSFFAAMSCAAIQARKTKVKWIVLVAVVLFTLPRPIQIVAAEIQKYRLNQFDNRIPAGELTALAFIRQHVSKNQVVQSSPYNENDRYAPYISFLSDHQTYISGERVLETHNQPIADRDQTLKFIFAAGDSHELAARTKAAGIDVLYIVKHSNHAEDLKFALSPSDFAILFENDTAVVAIIKK